MKILKIIMLLLLSLLLFLECSNIEISGGTSEVGNPTNGIMGFDEFNENENDTTGNPFDPDIFQE